MGLFFFSPFLLSKSCLVVGIIFKITVFKKGKEECESNYADCSKFKLLVSVSER